MKCPRCKTRELVVIDMAVSGQRVRLRSCSACEVRWWEGGTGLLALDGLLALATDR
ncbi:MAG TPA: hypothetical protein VG184_09740 [Acidimicrobiales bacterium]|nr:hypothetical protein [Acidimicrobiales bacterium]